MTDDGTSKIEFLEGDEVVLARGTYQGTAGIFVKLRRDANWSHTMQGDGRMRSHPVGWLAHSTDGTPGFATRRAQ